MITLGMRITPFCNRGDTRGHGMWQQKYRVLRYCSVRSRLKQEGPSNATGRSHAILTNLLIFCRIGAITCTMRRLNALSTSLWVVGCLPESCYWLVMTACHSEAHPDRCFTSPHQARSKVTAGRSFAGPPFVRQSRVSAASPDEAELGYAPLLLALDDGSRCANEGVTR